MILDITPGIQHKGYDFPFELEEAWPEDFWGGDAIAYEESVRVSGVYRITEEIVIVEATAEAAILAPCARCLTMTRVPVRAALSEAYARRREGDPKAPEILEEQYLYQGHTLDLTDAVRVALLQELPSRILCGEDCKGLCDVCGCNLNTTTCSCQKDAFDRNPFSALASLAREMPDAPYSTLGEDQTEEV